MQAFYKEQFTQIEMALLIDRPLELLPSGDYFEDEQGIPGRITAQPLDGAPSFSILITERVGSSGSHQDFVGYVNVNQSMVGKTFALLGSVAWGGLELDLSKILSFVIDPGSPPVIRLISCATRIVISYPVNIASVALDIKSRGKMVLDVPVAATVRLDTPVFRRLIVFNSVMVYE